MTEMLRACALAILVAAFVVVPSAADDQQAVKLNVTVVLVDAAGAMTPVPRHTLLVSDSPPSAAPRRIVTAADGTGTLNLLPGTYIVESDQPVAFEGQGYRWIQPVDVAAGADTLLALTVDNAIVGPAPASTSSGATGGREEPEEADPSVLLMTWQDSVVGLWSPTRHASGFVIDPRGLIATSLRAIDAATTVEVQLTDTVKVVGVVVAADPEGDVAIVRVASEALASIVPLPLDCAAPIMPLVDEQELLTIGAPMRGARDIEYGSARRLIGGVIAVDFRLRRMSPGGPVFAADGDVVGITSIADTSDERFDREAPVSLLNGTCAAIRSAETALRDDAPPDGAHLPVEPATPLSEDVLESAIAERADDLSPYKMSASEFAVTFLTPVQVRHGLDQTIEPALDFSNWSAYVRDIPPVLLVRVTPKESESFWMKVARVGAATQGALIPSMKRFTTGFARMRAFCGDAEVTPLHPFRLELQTSATEAFMEGLVVFAPDALGPHCGSVRLMMYSEKDPEKADTREVDATILQQIWQDFTTLRIVG